MVEYGLKATADVMEQELKDIVEGVIETKECMRNYIGGVIENNSYII